MLLQPMRLSPTGMVKGQLRFYGTRDSSIPISNPTMGTDILQFCHERFNISFSPEINKSQNVLLFYADLVTILSLKRWTTSASGSDQRWDFESEI